MQKKNKNLYYILCQKYEILLKKCVDENEFAKFVYSEDLEPMLPNKCFAKNKKNCKQVSKMLFYLFNSYDGVQPFSDIEMLPVAVKILKQEQNHEKAREIVETMLSIIKPTSKLHRRIAYTHAMHVLHEFIYDEYQHWTNSSFYNL